MAELEQELPVFSFDTVCSMDTIWGCANAAFPSVRHSWNILLYDFYTALFGVVALFVLRPLGIALLTFCALAALLALVFLFWRLIALGALKRRMRPIKAAGWQYLEASLAFYPDRVELELWNGKGLHVAIPYPQVTAILHSHELLLLKRGQDMVFAAGADLPDGLLAFLRKKCPQAKWKTFDRPSPGDGRRPM